MKPIFNGLTLLAPQDKSRPRFSISSKFSLFFAIFILISTANIYIVKSVVQQLDGIAETVNIAGRLRMLSQKIALETVHADTEVKIKDVFALLRDYENSLRTLERGGAANGFRISAVADSLDAYMLEVRREWTGYRWEVEYVLNYGDDKGLYSPDIKASADALLNSAENLVTMITLRAQEVKQRAGLSFIVLFLTEALIFAFVAYHIQRRIVAPLTRLALHSNTLANGTFDNQIRFSSNDEIGLLVASFNNATRKIGDLIEKVEHDNGLLKEAEWMFRGLADNSIVGVYIIQDKQLVYVNKVFAAIFGYEQDTVQHNMGIADLFHQDDVVEISKRIQRRMSGEQKSDVYRARGLHKNGHIIYVEVHGSQMQLSTGTAVMGVMLDVSEDVRKQESLEYLANYDPLTGLANRYLFHKTLENAIEQAQQQHSQLAVMLIDIDYFKIINDSLGHAAGDILLADVATRLRNCIDEDALAARLGGDEFIVLISASDARLAADIVAEKIHAALRAPFQVHEKEFFIHGSIGVALFPLNGEGDVLVKHADLAMYQAKAQGRNTSYFYSDDLSESVHRQQVLQSLLHRAIENNEFALVYQPKVNLQTGEISGVEALIRWHHPEYGIISPAEFIPLAEDTGLILPIGDWVLKTACAQNKQWQAEGLSRIPVAVNLSGKQLQNYDLAACIKNILAATGLEAKYLELELTETILMECYDETVEKIVELQQQGISIAMDDFGTGYSSLTYLKSFPFNSLKLDKAFVADVDTDRASAEIVKSVVAMGKVKNMNIIAEGIETEAQLRFMREQGCDEMQGYYCSPPISAAEMSNLLASRQRFLL